MGDLSECPSTKTFEDKVDTFSGFTEANINITEPMKFNAKMEMRSLTLMAGMNNTGKSLYNKLTWCATFFFNLKLMEAFTNTPEEMPPKQLMQFILDKSFVEANFDGTIEFNYRDPLLKVKFYGISMKLVDGKIVELEWELSKNTEPMGAVTYLSTDVRNFANIQKYVKIKKMMGITDINSFDQIEQLSEFYKIYDVFAIEFLLKKLENVNTILKQIQSMDSSNKLIEEFGIVSLDYNKAEAELSYLDDKDTKRNITTLGQGAQSMLIMIMTAVA